jgi:hypothetical protein
MVQSIEDGNRDEPSAPRPGWLMPTPLVWPSAAEGFDIFHDYPMKSPVPDHQDLIEAFSPHTRLESFADRIGLWRAVGCLEDFNGGCLGVSGEIVAAPAIPIANRRTQRSSKGCSLGKLLSV